MRFFGRKFFAIFHREKSEGIDSGSIGISSILDATIHKSIENHSPHVVQYKYTYIENVKGVENNNNSNLLQKITIVLSFMIFMYVRKNK